MPHEKVILKNKEFSTEQWFVSLDETSEMLRINQSTYTFQLNCKRITFSGISQVIFTIRKY